MKVLRPKSFAVLLLSLAAFGAGGHFAAKTFIEGRQTRQLEDLTNVVLRRSEAAVDFAKASLDEIGSHGNISCEPAALQIVRLGVYQRSAVKDIRLVNPDGSVICSAYSETLEFDKKWIDREEMQVSRDASVLLFRVEQFGGDALGVFREIDRQHSLVAILGVDSYLFDVAPAELRAHSEVLLELTNGDELGRFSLEDIESPHAVDFTKTSSRYPLRATIRVTPDALAAWTGHGYLPAMLVSLGLGLLFGLSLIRTRRLEGPVADIDRALAKKQFKPFFQPIFQLGSGDILGCEVLARWIRDNGTVVPPLNFIPLAESSGRIRKMTWQILAAALNDLQPYLREHKGFKLSFNVVPDHLLSDGFVDELRRTVLAARVSARQIVLEVTERDELRDLKKAATVVQELRDYGFRVAIDDVGVGHNGLSQLKGLGANTMKIDKFFVDTVTEDGSTAVIIEALVRLSKELQMTVVAEGIETEEQVRALIACGVEEGQGYLVSPPLPFGRFTELLEARRSRAFAQDVIDSAALVA